MESEEIKQMESEKSENLTSEISINPELESKESETIESELEKIISGEEEEKNNEEISENVSQISLINNETSTVTELQTKTPENELVADNETPTVKLEAVAEGEETKKDSEIENPGTSDNNQQKEATKTDEMNPEDLLNLLKSLSPEKLNQIKNKVFEIAEEKNQEKLSGSDESSKLEGDSNIQEKEPSPKPVETKTNSEQEKETPTEEPPPKPVVAADDGIICLDSDDEDMPPAPIPAQESFTVTIRAICENTAEKPSTTMNLATAVKLQLKECINPNCPRNPDDEYSESPVFVMNIFYVARKPNKAQWVCSACLNEAYDIHEQLCTNISNNIPWTSIKIPKKRDLVEISDSDEESNSNSKKYPSLPEKDLIVFDHETEMQVEEILNGIINRVDIKMQLDNEYQEIENRMKRNGENLVEIDEQLKVIEHKSQAIYNGLYDINRPKIERRPSFHVEFSLTQPTQENKPTSAMVKNVYFNRSTSNASTSPATTANRNIPQYIAPPQTEFNAYAAKPRPPFSGALNGLPQWTSCKFIEELEGKQVKVKFTDSGASEAFTIVSGKEFAHDQTSETLEIGTRVIAKFPRSTRNRSMKPITVHYRYLPGVVGEKLTNYNKRRYLVFCDYGQVKYCPPSEVRKVLDSSPEVWDDVHMNLRQFIRDYLMSRKEEMKSRAMLNLQTGAKILVEQANDWRHAIVQEVDCSLAKIFFPHLKSFEWLYRGSKRLHQIYMQAAKSNSTTQRSAFRRDPGISYYAIDDDNDDSNSSETKRNIAKKSTGGASDNTQQQVQQAVPQPSDKVIILNDDKIYLEDPIHVGKVRHFTPKASIKPRPYKKHDCSEECRPANQNDLSSFSQLAKPLLACWERQIVRHKNNRWVVYRAPCGRRLRNMLEIFNYLRLTKSNLNVDNFDLENMTQVLATYTIQQNLCGYYNPDCSGGKEGMKIPVVNAFDDQVPPPLQYSANRIPMPGVKINTDPEFMSCCDCTDDCVDKRKCACFQLTIQGAKKLMPDDDDDISYVWKRLPKNVPTGIYECNSRCKCSSRCLNKVVQHPISVKMQLYRTKKRGWGLKSLHDIPKGTFICIYAGNLYTEKDANALCQGLEHGDEYFAELDLIEVVEGMKEGYEVGTKYPDTDDEKASDSDSDYDESKDDGHQADGDFIARTTKTTSGREILTRSSKTSVASDNRNNSEDSSDEMVNLIPAPNTRIPLRKLFGPKEKTYIMDAKKCGNIGRYFNHSCEPNLYVQNVFVDTHDLRFPWIAFFTSRHIKAGEELTWNYQYEIGSVPSKVLYCHCGAKSCIGRIL